jgi:hypothetical protein
MTNTRKAAPSTVSSDAILKKQMSTIYADLDAIAVESHYAVSRDQQFSRAIEGYWKLRYGFRSCHWISASDGGQGLSAARTVGRPALSI